MFAFHFRTDTETSFACDIYLFRVFSDDLVFGLNILHRFSFDAVSSAFFSVDSFFVLRYGALTMVIKLRGL